MISAAIPKLVPRQADFDLAAYEIPHRAPFLLDLKVEEGELSRAIAHVSNVEYVRWLDRAAELHADALGYTRAWMLEQGLMWFVARHEIDYHAEVWPDDELVVATWVRDMQRVRSWRDYMIIRPSDASVVCRAATLWVLVRLESRRPVRISRAMAERFTPLEVPVVSASRSVTEGGEPVCTSP